MVSVFSLVCVLCVEKVFDFVGRALGLSLLRSAHHPTIIRLRLNKVKVIIGLFFYIIIFIIAINSLTFRLFDNNVLYSNWALYSLFSPCNAEPACSDIINAVKSCKNTSLFPPNHHHCRHNNHHQHHRHQRRHHHCVAKKLWDLVLMSVGLSPAIVTQAPLNQPVIIITIWVIEKCWRMICLREKFGIWDLGNIDF